MGLLIDGIWHDEWYDTKSTGGKFVRQESSFRNYIGKGEFKAEKGRYHLYVSYACPWAHRALIFRMLKNLEDIISLSYVDYYMGSVGWTLPEGQDPINNKSILHEIYTTADSKYTGRVTVPVLWDKKLNTIVNNESSEIIRMFNSEFNHITKNNDDYYPEDIRKQIDEINDFVYSTINNGVYKAGFATKQEVYEAEVVSLFKALDKVEEILKNSKYLVGDKITEADWRLFTTLIRFDAVYVGHFKCNIRRIEDYPYMQRYLTELYNIPGIADTTNFDHIKKHYYISHKSINPTGIVPHGPDLAVLNS